MYDDSKENTYFSWYLDELKKAGYISEWIYEPKSYNLFDPIKRIDIKKNKEIERKLLGAHSYTPDFGIIWNESAYDIFTREIKELLPSRINNPFFRQGNRSVIEVKPIFDRNNMIRLFSINQRWVYQKIGRYVQLIVPEKLFKDTFTPLKYLFTDSGRQPRKIKFTTVGLTYYVSERSV